MPFALRRPRMISTESASRCMETATPAASQRFSWQARQSASARNNGPAMRFALTRRKDLRPHLACVIATSAPSLPIRPNSIFWSNIYLCRLAPRNAAQLTHIKRNGAPERLLQKNQSSKKKAEYFNHAAAHADAPGPASTRPIDRAPVPHRGGRVNCRLQCCRNSGNAECCNRWRVAPPSIHSLRRLWP